MKYIHLFEDFNNPLIVYKVGEIDETSNRIFVTKEGYVEQWREYLGEEQPVYKLWVKKAYVPYINVDFKSWEEIEGIELSEKEKDYITLDETNIEQYDVKFNDIIEIEKID